MIFENLSSIDLAYKIGSLAGKQEIFKFIDESKSTKLYLFSNPKLSIVLIVFNLEKKVFYIEPNTDIVELVDFFDEFFLNTNIENISLKESELEDLVVDKIENIYVTILTEDNISIDLDENLFPVIPNDGDLLNNKLLVNNKKTEEKKLTIAEKFNKLKK